MATIRTDQGQPTLDQGLTVFTATRLIEGNATTMRVGARAKGEKEKGCIVTEKSDFISQLTHEADKFLSGILAPNSTTAKERLARFTQLKCCAIAGRLEVLVDDTIVEYRSFGDYNFDNFDWQTERSFGTEFNGKVVVAKLSVATNMNRNNVWQVWVESTTPD